MVINSFFDKEVQDLVHNPILESWPTNIEDYTHDQLVERVNRSSDLELVRAYVLNNFKDSDPRKGLYLDEIEFALGEFEILFSEYPREMEVPDTFLDDINELTKGVARNRPYLDTQTILNSDLIKAETVENLSKHLEFIHRAIFSLEKEINCLAQEHQSATERNRYISQYTIALDKYRHLISTFIGDINSSTDTETRKKTQSKREYKSKMQVRIEIIVETLIDLGYGGLRPRHEEPGSRGAKAEVKDRLLNKHYLFHISESSFKKAWEATPQEGETSHKHSGSKKMT